tara:strand:+ start:266 stop:520 length:255 start_codon:yes stop_codon:yes gene_type:complete
MGSSKGKVGGSGGGASVKVPGRMAGDILAGINSDELESQETSDENIMEMPEFDSATQDSLSGGFLQKTNPTVGGSYLGGARKNF